MRLAWGLLVVSLVFAGDTNLNAFYPRFVERFSSHNANQLIAAGQVRFPLELKGTLDDSPQIRLARKDFARAIRIIAGQPSGLNPNDASETEAQYQQRLVAAGRAPEDAGEGTVRSGNLVFALSRNKTQWQLVKVYTSDEIIESLQKPTGKPGIRKAAKRIPAH